MCKAHVLRFSCNHGVLMSLEPCRLGPCPMLRTTGVRLPQQPYKCYNCQYKLGRRSTTGSSSSSSIDSLNSSSSTSSSPPLSSSMRRPTLPTHPLPNVAVQPSNCTSLRNMSSSRSRNFSFSCNGSDHFATPHYSSLPDFLPHQDHGCPSCQLEAFRADADAEAIRSAKAEFPNLRGEMLVRDGRIWEDWMTKPTLEKYVDEKRTEEREMWLHVTRKWTQDLKKARVLVAEEDGLGLFG